MLYKKNNGTELSKELFNNPTSEYRGTPFWAWNCKLNKEMLIKQIEQMKEMGLGGFHMHSRTGMATEYLSDEFMELIKICNEKAKEENMLAWLYDEDRWPSGFAGGYITKDHRYRARAILFSPKVLEGFLENKEAYDLALKDGQTPKGYLISAYSVTLENGFLKEYTRLSNAKSNTKGANWFAYMEIAQDDPWFNNQAYVNTLDSKAIEEFVKITHEKYYQELGHDFGKTIPAIFTDEPQFTRKEAFSYAEERKSVKIPFTDDFSDTYRAEYGNDILDLLPELFWNLPDNKPSVARYRYHDHLSERFVSAFSDTIGDWCEKHNIMLTGHLMSEASLLDQTGALGDAMRSYRSFQLPGIDMLCDAREFSTAKQAQSATHQYGREGVLSELYGVTNWDFDFKGHKLQGDWQAALGVTVRVHHLTWVSMAGEAKRDYPACIGYQSPWYKEYPLIENHFARINTALTRGKPSVKIGVIHPVESYWLHWGPQEQTFMEREELENSFRNTIEWLLFNLLDFDFICESLLPSQSPEDMSKTFKVGKMDYDVIVVPNCQTLRSSTVARLESFVKAGGKVIFAGSIPNLVDAIESDHVKQLANQAIEIPLEKTALVNALNDHRLVDVWTEGGTRTDNIIYQLREEGDNRWLFLCHASHKTLIESWMGAHGYKEKLTVKIKGIWNPTLYDTMTGDVKPCPAEIKNNETWITHVGAIHDSILLYLEPGEPLVAVGNPQIKPFKGVDLADPVPITLSEPNVLLLDMASYSFDEGNWQPEEEILLIDNEFRKQLGYPLRLDAMAQPWVSGEKAKEDHLLQLKFIFNSEIDLPKTWLALEDAETTEILLNGNKVYKTIEGWFVDEAIKKVKLPSMKKGTNEIILRIPFGPKTNVEWCYLLGDFGVKVTGRHKKIVEPVRSLAFGDWTTQGLPFYAGNVTYHSNIEVEETKDLTLQTLQFPNPLLKVSLNGKDIGAIAFAPYELHLGELKPGKHNLDITAFGNRFNAFGCIHNSSTKWSWYGPYSWRTIGDNWSYQYRIRPMGLLVSPRIGE